ncbi:energy-coupling factor ABC transporter ATP-binding protein [Providencia rustigianii]|uniref:Energy-coupling factor transporter ATP-binding protein EcfA1 n=1 Tax=Providencia rustigianii TaxID=158850 RepID=A0A379G3Y9_9GAMM|nr:energy-coupling factor ABC transporter ATP-binding protein [Providencia rustigianii]SUC35749.1 Energy-coupling factor transporter ATP-binding protein EcfA1 [Providencia rustigianii]
MVINIKQMTFTPKGSETPLLGPLDLQLAQGDWLCILGGNGSGKSTLAQLLAGWYPDQLSGLLSGTSLVLSQEIGQGTLVNLAANRQWVQQSPQLQLSGCTFSVEQEVAFGPENLGLSPEEIQQRVEHALELTFCDCLRTRHPATLSGGEAQRVVLACAIAMRPQLLLLDEAFSRLTPAATERLLSQLKQYSQLTGCCIVLFERHLLPALHFCNNFMLLEQGKSVAIGDIEQVFLPAQRTINMPDAWRVIGHLIQSGVWDQGIPRDEQQLLQGMREYYATN